MIETGIGLFYGVVLGLCVAPLWMMLQIPMRTCEFVQSGNMRLCGWALAIGSTLAALNLQGILPDLFGIVAMTAGGIFTGMIAAALVEAVEVVPVLYDRLSISTDMRFAALAIAIGKGAGAFLAPYLIGGI